jgi:NAD(P)-dependent dehydrogenase (short-subunit alcohol dehydrogenase family)
MKPILITGAKGLLGANLMTDYAALGLSVSGIDRSVCDLTDAAGTARVVQAIAPGCDFNAAYGVVDSVIDHNTVANSSSNGFNTWITVPEQTTGTPPSNTTVSNNVATKPMALTPIPAPICHAAPDAVLSAMDI